MTRAKPVTRKGRGRPKGSGEFPDRLNGVHESGTIDAVKALYPRKSWPIAMRGIVQRGLDAANKKRG